MAVELTSQNFEKEVLKSDIPVLVDFWALWCSPCRMVAPIVEEIAKEYEGKIKVGKVNVDQDQKLASKYSVMSIPSFIMFKNGEAVSRFMGVQAKERIVEEIKRVISK